jgi:hypothetical protein
MNAPVWVLIAVVRSPTFIGGVVTAYGDVYATADACEDARAQMQSVYDKTPSDHTVWVCRRELPK